MICKFSCILTTESNKTHGSSTAPSVEVFPACLGTAQCWVFPWEPSHLFLVCHYSGANTFEKTLCMESPYIRAHACSKASHTSTVGHVSFEAPMLLEHAFGCWGQLINHASTIPLGKHFPQWNCSRFRRQTFPLSPHPYTQMIQYLLAELHSFSCQEGSALFHAGAIWIFLDQKK